jgi:hypothetical protein
MNTWNMTSIEVLPAVTLHEVNVTPVIDLAIKKDSPAPGVVFTVAQQNTFLGPGLEMPLLQLHRYVNHNLTPPYLDVGNVRLVPCQKFPRNLRRTSGLQTVMNVHCSHDCIRPELKVQTTVYKHGPDKMINALNHAFCMPSLLMNVWGSELMHNLQGKDEI